MAEARSEAIFEALLTAAQTLRDIADVQIGAAGEPLAFRRSTLGLAALIESWCVDNVVHFLPELVAGRQVESSEDERALLGDIVARIRR